MKNKLLLLGFTFLALSCSSDDSGNDNVTSTADFLPLNAGNYWVYDVESDVEEGSGRDSLYVANDTVINGNTYKKFKTLNMPWGFYTSALANNGVRKSDDKLLLNGSAAVNFSEDLPFSVDVTDLVIFKENTSGNELLGSVSDVLSQPYDENTTLEFDYTLTSTAKENLATYTAGGTQYTNVKPIEIKLSMNVTAVVEFSGTSFPINVMPQQDIIVSTQYYAEGIGVVHVVTDFEYALSDVSQLPIDLPLPSSAAVHQEEVLDTYVAE
jgi:hypothetical protein